MGLFGKDVVCGACGKMAGFNRYRAKDTGSWVCASCAKAAGGLGVISGMTVSEIKAAIAGRAAASNQAASSEIQTAEVMYHTARQVGWVPAGVKNGE